MFHETYTVCTGLAIRSPAAWRYRGKTHYQSANGVMLMEPGETHANTGITDPASFRVLMIEPSVVIRAAQALGMSVTRPHLRIAQLRGGSVHRALRGLHAALEAETTALERQSRFAACFRLLLEQCAERAPPPVPREAEPAAVQRARMYLHENMMRHVSLGELVRAAGATSEFGLIHAFSAQVGIPPHAYQLHLRVGRAQRLLALGISCAQVAADLGFADQSHFTRQFRRALGVTPAAYARQGRGATAAFSPA